MNVNEIITNRIIEGMQKTGVAAWRKPWNTYAFKNAVSKKEYRGVNVLMLSLFGKGEWYITPKQIFAHGGNIKKGSKTVPIVFWNIKKEERNSAGDVTQRGSYLLRYYNVLAIEDTENVKINLPVGNRLDFMPIEEAEKLVKASGAVIKHEGQRAFYSPSSHTITMPNKETFQSVEHYYATLMHELTHWARTEVEKDIKWGNFGNESYSKEELTAEVGANFLLSYCGIDASATFDNSLAYLNNWISKLTADPKLIVSASSQAQKRFDWLMAKLNPKAVEAVEAEETEELVTA